jgi:hypothetical protein
LLNRNFLEKTLHPKKGDVLKAGYFLVVKYSCIALAARLPAPMALITVAAPVATSPPA